MRSAACPRLSPLRTLGHQGQWGTPRQVPGAFCTRSLRGNSRHAGGTAAPDGAMAGADVGNRKHSPLPDGLGDPSGEKRTPCTQAQAACSQAENPGAHTAPCRSTRLAPRPLSLPGSTSFLAESRGCHRSSRALARGSGPGVAGRPLPGPGGTRKAPFSLQELRQPRGHPGAEDTRRPGPYRGRARCKRRAHPCAKAARPGEVPGCRAPPCLRKKREST